MKPKARPMYIFSEISVSPAPAPRLLFLMNVVYEHLPEVLLTSNPRCVLQYVISVLLQLNIESSAAQFDATINTDEHQLNRTVLRENVLGVLNSSIQLTSLPLVQQTAFALHLLTVSVFSFDYGQPRPCLICYVTTALKQLFSSSCLYNRSQ